MAGIGANSLVAKNPVSASGRLEHFPVQGAFVRQPISEESQPVCWNHGSGLTMTAVGRQLAAMPCDRYLIRLIHGESRKAFPGERLWTTAQLTHAVTIRFLRARNREGYDIYFRPFIPGGNAGYILVDLDRLHPAVLGAMVTNGHEPCVVTETSPDHLQAWVRVSGGPLTFTIATAIARQFAQLYQADPASADGHHLGRLAGFTNQKPQRRLATGLAPWVKVRQAALVIASRTPTLDAPRSFAVRQSALQAAKTTVAGAHSGAGFTIADGDTLTPDQAAAIYQTWMHRLCIRQRFPTPDWSIVDLWIAKQLLQSDMAPRRVKAVLRLASPHFPRCHADPEDYLRRTLARALGDLSHGTFPARATSCNT